MLERLVDDIILCIPCLVAIMLALGALFGGKRLRISTLGVLVIGPLVLVASYVVFRSPEGKRTDRIQWSGIRVTGNAREGYGISLIVGPGGDKGDDVIRAAYDDLKALPNLTFVFIKSHRVTDDGVCLLATLPAVEVMVLDSVRISREGLACLSRMPRLRALNLLRARCQGEDLAILSASRSLHTLSIAYTTLDEQDMKYIASIESLRVVKLFDATASEKAIATLRRMRPDLQIGY